MSHSSPPTPSAFKAKDAASYDGLTHQFDYFTERLSAPLAAHLVALAQLAPDDRVLDIGTGTGIVARKAATALGTGGRVAAIDLSEEMLGAARVRAREAGLVDRIDYIRMDAEALHFGEGTFDVALALFALLHFPDPLGALGEMRRVLRPGGRLVVAVGSRPPLGSLRTLAHYLGRIPEVPLVATGRQLSGPSFLNSLAARYCPAAVEADESESARAGLNRTHRTRSLVRQAGFADIRCGWEGHRFTTTDIDEFWELQRTFSSIARKRIAEASLRARESLRSEFSRRCRAVLSRGGRLVYPYGAFFVTARRPLEPISSVANSPAVEA